MDYKVISKERSLLGEGAYYHDESKRSFWVDIDRSNIHLYEFESGISRVMYVGDNPSSIIDVENETLLYIDRYGINEFDLTSETSQRIFEHPNHDPSRFRANDGTKLKDNIYIYGTMCDYPESETGKIYIYDKFKHEIYDLDLNIHIPNSFVILNDEVLISDSYKKIVYKVFVSSFHISNKTIWKDFSSYDFTPDGGCVSKSGLIYLALWDGGKIIILDSNSDYISSISLPFKRPTNCKFTLDGRLMITSALTNEAASGSTILLPLGGIIDDF
ncbi:SMP-30/gluconolactonase/LRE family protein [Vibrio sp. AK197]